MCVRIGFSWLFLQHEQLTKSLSQRINYCFSRCFSTSKLSFLAVDQRAWVWHAANLFLLQNPPWDGRAQHDNLSNSKQGKHLHWVWSRWKLTLTLITLCIQSQWMYNPEESERKCTDRKDRCEFIFNITVQSQLTLSKLNCNVGVSLSRYVYSIATALFSWQPIINKPWTMTHSL